MVRIGSNDFFDSIILGLYAFPNGLFPFPAIHRDFWKEYDSMMNIVFTADNKHGDDGGIIFQCQRLDHMHCGCFFPEKCAGNPFFQICLLISEDDQVGIISEAFQGRPQPFILVKDIHTKALVISHPFFFDKWIFNRSDNKIETVQVASIIEMAILPISEVGTE